MKKKAMYGLGAICIAAMMILQVSAVMNGTYDKDVRPSSDLEVKIVKWGNIKCFEKKLVAKKADIQLGPVAVPADIPVTSNPETEFRPSIAMDNDGNLLIAYEIQPSIVESDIYYIVSTDNGETWTPTVYLPYETVEQYPAVDYWGQGNRFFSTLMPDPTDYDGAAQYLIECTDLTDPESYSVVYFDWTSYNFHDRQSPDIACYDGRGIDWFYGIIVSTADCDYPDGEQISAPVINYASPDDENSGYIGWPGRFNNSAHAAVDVDRSTGYMYGAWDWMSDTAATRHILILKRDINNVPGSEYFWIELGGNEMNTYPSVAAANDNIMVVCQSDEQANQDIICYYSMDGGDSWEKSFVTESPDHELYPDIISTGDRSAVCAFVKNGNLYYSKTSDGGMTWTEVIQINDQDGKVLSEYRTASITRGGVAWSDTRDNTDVYYDTLPVPVIGIESVSGGFGVKATVTNTGSLDANDIDWSINIDGNLILIGKETTGTIPSLPAGGQEIIKSSLVFGIGRATINVDAGGATKTASGFVLGPLVLGVK